MPETANDLLDIEAVDLHKIARLTTDLRVTAAAMGRDEARYLVDAYYSMQDFRKAGANQRRAADNGDAPAMMLLNWLTSQFATLETRTKDLLGSYAEGSRVGRWSLGLYGVGPVIAAGLLAHIDMGRAVTVGHIYRYAGLDPSSKWVGREEAAKRVAAIADGQRGPLSAEQLADLAAGANLRFEALVARIKDKDGNQQEWTKENVARALSIRPWNASLKTLCWKAGQCFMKFSGADECYYGHRWAERKAQEVERNAAGLFAEEAARALREKTYGKETEAFKWYSQGKLPPAHVEARAERWTVKLFLSHWWEVAYTCHYGGAPAPSPYAVAQLGHAHKVEVPGWPCP